MKILLVTPFYPPDAGGIAYHVYNLASILSKRHNVIVLSNYTGGKKLKKEIVDKAIQIIRIPSVAPPPIPYETLTSFRIPLGIASLIKIIKELDPDIVHVHGHHYPITWLATHIANQTKIPIVLTLHGMYALTIHRTYIEELFNETIFKWLLLSSNAIIAVSRAVADYARKYVRDRKPIIIIPNGICVEVYYKNFNKKIEYRKKYGLPEDKIIILYRGRFTQVKGVLELVKAIVLLNKYEAIRQNVLFVFVGDGPLRSTIVNILKPYDNCIIMGWTPKDKVHELYIASDIYVIPSLWHEAFSITTLEAMAAGLFIVASDRGGIVEILERYPRKIIIKDVSAIRLAAVLKNIVMRWDNLRLERKFCSHVISFDWYRITSKVEKLYKVVVNVS